VRSRAIARSAAFRPDRAEFSFSRMIDSLRLSGSLGPFPVHWELPHIIEYKNLTGKNLYMAGFRLPLRPAMHVTPVTTVMFVSRLE